MPARMLSIAELAEVTGWGEQTLRDHRNGDEIVFDSGHRLPLLRLGTAWRVPAHAVEELLGEPLTVEVAS